MKKRTNRDLVLFFILIPLFIIGAFYISSRMDNKLPPYTVDNKGRPGYSVFYDTLKELRLPVEKQLQPVHTQNTNTVQLVAQTGTFDIGSEELKTWIEKGGTLIYLTPENMHFIDYAGTPETKGSLKYYKYGSGEIIAGDIEAITNNTLLREKDSAYEIYGEMAGKGGTAYFNENHIYVKNAEASLWDYVPLEWKFIIYQLVLVLIAFFYYKGKRFGRPVPYYEESERSENEYLFSAASLYRQARSYDLMVDSYYESLLGELRCSHEEFLECWERQKLSSIDKAQRVYEFVNRKEKSKKAKEYIQIVSTLEQLRRIVRKRRDSYWKTLKKI